MLLADDVRGGTGASVRRTKTTTAVVSCERAGVNARFPAGSCAWQLCCCCVVVRVRVRHYPAARVHALVVYPVCIMGRAVYVVLLRLCCVVVVRLCYVLRV